jgi:hypothetical protein
LKIPASQTWAKANWGPAPINPTPRGAPSRPPFYCTFPYVFKGVVLKYRPDYLIRLTSGKMLVLEVKGQDDQQQKTKREFLAEWVRAVNQHGGFGNWAWDVSHNPKDLLNILRTHNQ